MNNEIVKLAAQKHPDKIMYPFEELYEQLGYDGLSIICDLYGGGSLYVPTAKRMFSQCIYEEIKNEKPGTDIRRLVHKYGLCERTVRMILYEQK